MKEDWEMNGISAALYWRLRDHVDLQKRLWTLSSHVRHEEEEWRLQHRECNIGKIGEYKVREMMRWSSNHQGLTLEAGDSRSDKKDPLIRWLMLQGKQAKERARKRARSMRIDEDWILQFYQPDATYPVVLKRNVEIQATWSPSSTPKTSQVFISFLWNNPTSWLESRTRFTLSNNLPGNSGIHSSRRLHQNSPFGGNSLGLSSVP